MMRKLEGKELKDKIMTRYVDNLVMAKKLIDSLIPVVNQFDGKVYNKRFENALKARLEELKEQTEGKQVYCSVELNYRHINIELEFYNHRRIAENNYNVYIPQGYETLYICYHYTDWSSWNNESNEKYYHKDNGEYFYIDGGNTRINAKSIVDLLLEKQKELDEKIADILEASKNIEDIFKKVEELKAELKAINESIPTIVDKIYSVESYGQYNSW